MFGWYFGLHIFGHWLLVAAGIAGFIAALVYLPGRLGGMVAAACLAVAAVAFALDEGYRSAARLCRDQELKREIAARDVIIKEKDRQAKAAESIADVASARADAAEQANADRQLEIDRYAEELARRPADRRCILNDADVRELFVAPRNRSVAPPKPPAAADRLR